MEWPWALPRCDFCQPSAPTPQVRTIIATPGRAFRTFSNSVKQKTIDNVRALFLFLYLWVHFLVIQQEEFGVGEMTLK